MIFKNIVNNSSYEISQHTKINANNLKSMCCVFYKQQEVTIISLCKIGKPPKRGGLLVMVLGW